MTTDRCRRPRAAISALVCFGCLAVAPPARAQRANGPYAGLFGAAPAADVAQALSLTGDLYGEYDVNALPVLRGSQTTDPFTFDPRLTNTAGGGGASAALNYQLTGDRVRFGLGGTAGARAYPGMGSLAGMYSANTSLSTNVTPKLVVALNGSAVYSPFYDFAPFAGDATAVGGGLIGSSATGGAGFDYAAIAARNVSLTAGARISSNFTRRSSLSLILDGNDVRMLDDRAISVRTGLAEADFSHKLTRALALHFGYGRQYAKYGTASDRPYQFDTIDAGVDYGDSIPFGRRTSLTFGASTAEMRYQGATQFRVNGSAQLTRGFGRSWSTWLGYVRDTTYDPAFRGPLLNDSGVAGVGGQLALRVKWSAALGYTHGTVGFQSGSFTSYGISSRLDLAITRRLALYGQYVCYRYDIPPDLTTITFLPRFTRQSVTSGLSVWVPIVNEIRPPKEPRDR